MQSTPVLSQPQVPGWSLATRPAVLDLDNKLINATGALLDFTFARSVLMPTAPVNTSALLRVTNVAGVPTNLQVPSGSLAYDSAGSNLYYFNGVSWVAVGTAGASTLSTVLAAGNTTGANDIIISAAREIQYQAAIRIGGNTTATGVSAASAIAIGASAVAAGAAGIAIGQNSVASAASSVALGNGAVAAFSQSVAIGAGVSTTGPNQIVLGQPGWTTSVPGDLQLPLAAPLATTNLLAVTTMAGTPTSTPRVGSIAMDDTNRLLYMYTTASGWVTVGAAAPTPALSAVLAVGNTTGANNINITNGQQLGFSAGFGVRIGLDGTATGATNSTGISIGNATTSASALSSIAIGPDAVASQIGNIALGSLASATNVNSLAVGFNATCSGSQAVVLGSNSTAGSGINNTALGAATSITTTANNCTAVGQGITVPAGTVGNVFVGAGSVISSTPNGVVAVGYQNTVTGGTDNVIVGRSCTASNTYAIAIGSSVTASNANAIALGRTSTASGSTAIAIGLGASSAATASIAIGSGANAGTGTANIAIGQTITVPGVTGIYNTCIGQLSTITSLGDQNISIGAGNSIAGDATSDNNICIGPNITLTGNRADRIAIGRAASAGFTDCIAVGRGATASSSGSNALGPSSQAVATNATALGGTSTAAANGSTAVGYLSYSVGSSGTVVGVSAATGTGANCTIIGGNSTCGNGANNTILGASSSISSTSTGCIILGDSSSITSARTNATLLGRGILPANVTTDNSIYTPTTWATSAAGTAVSWDAATGLLHPNSSSLRYKQDLQPLKEPERILKLQVHNYALKPGHCGCTLPECNGLHCGRREVGAIAEEVAEILPELVVYSLNEETKHPQPESVLYDRLSLYLIEVVKSQQSQIEDLEAAISKLIG